MILTLMWNSYNNNVLAERERSHEFWINVSPNTQTYYFCRLTSFHLLVSGSRAECSQRYPALVGWSGGKTEEPSSVGTCGRVAFLSSIRRHLRHTCVFGKLTCPCCPGIPAPLLEISSVKEETYLLCSSRIMSNCRFSCLISRWMRFCPSKICLSSRSPMLSNISSAEMEIANQNDPNHFWNTISDWSIDIY